ncbi:hypothetical protein [Streptomyces sp. NPDC051662]|uniref:hypothetical protein n=1 Tax=Streptomyces sp. NPDC051662 TaxID=3154750 RepID=UPI00341D9E80
MHRCGWGRHPRGSDVRAGRVDRPGREGVGSGVCLFVALPPRLAPALWKRELKRSPARVQGTPLAHTIHAQVREGELEAARHLLSRERLYPVDDGLPAHLRE